MTQNSLLTIKMDGIALLVHNLAGETVFDGIMPRNACVGSVAAMMDVDLFTLCSALFPGALPHCLCLSHLQCGEGPVCLQIFATESLKDPTHPSDCDPFDRIAADRPQSCRIATVFVTDDHVCTLEAPSGDDSVLVVTHFCPVTLQPRRVVRVCSPTGVPQMEGHVAVDSPLFMHSTWKWLFSQGSIVLLLMTQVDNPCAVECAYSESSRFAAVDVDTGNMVSTDFLRPIDDLFLDASNVTAIPAVVSRRGVGYLLTSSGDLFAIQFPNILLHTNVEHTCWNNLHMVEELGGARIFAESQTLDVRTDAEDLTCSLSEYTRHTILCPGRQPRAQELVPSPTAVVHLCTSMQLYCVEGNRLVLYKRGTRVAPGSPHALRRRDGSYVVGEIDPMGRLLVGAVVLQDGTQLCGHFGDGEVLLKPFNVEYFTTDPQLQTRE